MTTTDASTTQRFAALEARRHGARAGKRRRPAEASRVLAAGAGTAAMLTMVSAMAQADQVVEVVDAPVSEAPAVSAPLTFDSAVTHPSVVEQVAAAQQPAIQTVTIARPARTQVANARTSASR